MNVADTVQVKTIGMYMPIQVEHQMSHDGVDVGTVML